MASSCPTGWSGRSCMQRESDRLMETLISQLLDLPDRVHKGDFVLNLSEGVTPDKAGRTLDEYVVTPQLADCFDNALGFIKSAIDARSSKAAYLHSSFGSWYDALATSVSRDLRP